MSRKSYNRHDRFFIFLITALCLCAAALVAAISVQSHLNARTDTVIQTLADGPEDTVAPLTMVAADSQLTATATPAPAEEPTPTPAPAPTATLTPVEYLPVYTRADTKEKVIAITLDDCSSLESLKYAALAANEYGAKLTLFPVASSLLKSDNAAALRTCVFDLGFEVENRTLNNSTLYALSDFEMANEIWTADTAVDYALNKDYGMHLLRTKGGLGVSDPRTHAYLRQLGYDGFVTWNISGASCDIDRLRETLSPGNIYLFNCTKDEVVKLAEFMKFAQSRGYAMVTVNELLGFPANSCADPADDIITRTLVQLEGYESPVMQYTQGDRSHGVYMLQMMLQKLGYLTDDSTTPTPAVEDATPAPTNFLDSVIATASLADGVYGQATVSAVMAFQASRGLPCTGVATVELQQMIAEEYESRFGTMVEATPSAPVAPVATAETSDFESISSGVALAPTSTPAPTPAAVG